MPEISRFLGIVIAMFYSDHAPPHFHARYGDHEVTVRIDDGAVDGRFPRRALALLLHREESRDNWERARTREPLQKIEPLE